jgi:hypothetical protein
LIAGNGVGEAQELRYPEAANKINGSDGAPKRDLPNLRANHNQGATDLVPILGSNTETVGIGMLVGGDSGSSGAHTSHPNLV